MKEFSNRKAKLLRFETEARAAGFKKIAGVDEAGRGPLAGPVVAACCMMQEGVFIDGVDDSKVIPPQKRRALFKKITTHPELVFGIGVVNVEVIDRINILQASLLAMIQALEAMEEAPDCILVDGNIGFKFHETQVKTIIEGDRLSHSIGAASILAKVTRDEIMEEHHKTYPQYRFDKHKGYGTEEHLALIKAFGPCPLHRKSFSPFKAEAK